MSQFNPNMSKEQLVNDFRAVDPSYNGMSDDLAYKVITRKFPQYKLESESFEYNPKDESGIVDKLGTIWKDGYNRSLQGMAEAIATNKKQVYDLGNYHPGIIGDIAASVSSFFTPLDFVTTVAGGGVGGAVAKGVARKLVYKRLLQNRVSKDVARKAALKASAFTQKAYAKTGGGAGALGLYSGAGEAMNEYLSDGTITPGKVVKAGAKGAVLGGMTGGTNAFLTDKGVNVLGRTFAEVGQFGTVAPLLEGRAPTPEDWVHAGGMVLGIKGVNMAATKGFDKLRKFKKYVVEPEVSKQPIPEGLDVTKIAEETGRRSYANELHDSIRTDSKGKREAKILSFDDKNVQARFLDTGEVALIPKDIWYNYYRKPENLNISPKELRAKRESEIRKLEKELGHSNEVKETNRGLHKAEKGKEALSKNLKDLGNENIGSLRDKLTVEKYTKKALEDMQKNGIDMQKTRFSVFLDDMLPAPANKLLDVFRPARNQGSVSPARRIYVAKVDKFVVDQRRTLSETFDLMSQFGLNAEKPTKQQVKNLAGAMKMSESEVSKKYWELLADAVEQGINTPETMGYKQISDFLFNRARESGVDVGYLENYIPRMLKQGLAEKVFADIYKISEMVSKQSVKKGEEMLVKDLQNDYIDLIIQSMNNPEAFAKSRGGEARFLNRIIKKAMPSLSKETKEAYESILEGVRKREGVEELSPFKAMALMGRLTYGEVFKEYGNLTKKRTYELPSKFYERDIRKLLGIYSSNVARASAETKNFGKKGKIYTELLKNAPDSDLPIIAELHNHVMGSIGYNRRYNLNPGIKDFMQKVMEWETSTKIALGTATAMNLSQFAISSALSAGYWRFTKGAYKYMTDKDFRKEVDASGGNLYKYINEMMGLSQQSDISKKVVGRLTDVSQFNRINSINNILAASTARVLIDDLVAISTGKRGIGLGRMGSKKWANNTLKKMGIDPSQIKQGKLPRSTIINSIGNFAVKSQLQKDILSDPLILNRPSAKPFLQFKSFGLRQYNFIMDTLKFDLAQGNFMPVLRLAAGGMATGALAIKAKELMKQLASGEKAYDPATFFETDAKEIVENIAAIGAFGFLGDFMMAGLEEGRSVTRALAFFASPPFMSDVSELFKFMGALERDYKNYQGDFIRRVPSRALRMTGSPLLKDVAKRLETKGLKQSRIEFLRGRRKSSIVDTIIKSETPEAYQQALEDMRNWNSTYPMYPILVTDIDYKAVIKRKMQKHKKRADI
tara:strand:+ start:29279 stop:33004 length:3726 start_codon:yes stop_codon:yes gene_type:complete